MFVNCGQTRPSVNTAHLSLPVNYLSADDPLEWMVAWISPSYWARLDTNKSLVVVESQISHNTVWVISHLGLINETNREKHFFVISNPFEAIQQTLRFLKQRLNFLDLLALWYGFFFFFKILSLTVSKCKTSSILRDELVAVWNYIST
jgi:hypothetical protein